MNNPRIPSPLSRARAIALGCLLIMGSFSLHAGATDLANIPLANATTVDILPNIMLDVDNSGSMALDHMPDYVSKNYSGTSTWCRGTDANNTLTVCYQGDPPYFASAFNGVYYNPAIRYSPAVNADGSIKTPVPAGSSTASPWDKVPTDAYGKENVDNNSASTSCTNQNNCPTYSTTATLNLTTNYPERVWCKNSTDTPPSANCKSALSASNTYIYPDSTYKYLKVLKGAPHYYNVSVEWCKNADTAAPYKNYGKVGTCQAKKDSTYKYVRFFNWSRVDIKPATTSYPKAATRTDCAGSSCTYAEEMTNFANWFAWYSTRMKFTKTAIGLAFSEVRGTPNPADATDTSYFHARIGITTINNPSTNKLNINNFDSGQKTSFYSKLYALDPSSTTPLRTSLDSLGVMYKGASTLYSDPIQYSCQKNFTILTTDGYWNDTYSGVGDVDGASGVTRPSYDKLGTANTLADVAYYYYHTDLRPGTCAKCTDNVHPAGSDDNVDDVAQHQHMTTFTVGLGVDGTLKYQDGYKTSTSGDYFDIVQGTKNWPKPTSNSQETIDDLWHAAVNGRGTYFSARDPAALQDGLKKALGIMEATVGSGAAAATSNLQPEVGDNFIYIANYRTVYWDGELSAYTINLSDGAINATPAWQASTLLDAKIAASGDSDSRVIYTGEDALRSFNWTDLTIAEKAYFNNNQLSQYSDWDATQLAAGTGENLLKYIRGHNRYEDQNRDVSFGAYSRLYRDRAKIIGDIVHGQPIYVKGPRYSYADAGYSAYKTAQSSRLGTVYAAANDGMLHAFDSDTGQERWAYVPPMVMPNLWRLADENYPNNHRFFLDGPLAVSDIYTGGAWKTILVGGLGKGGRGYYALDITNPSSPDVMWSFTVADDSNLGYSYGIPMITKLKDGTWVVAVASGYNNVSPGDGKGYLYVLNAGSGTLLKTIPTGEGTSGQPSGLARVNIKAADFEIDNTALAAYGGDLYGNMYAFDLDADTKRTVISLGNDQPITAAPELGEIDGKTVLFFGTGRYLGQDDLDDTQTQAIYAVRDDGVTASKSNLQAQTLTDTSGSSRSASANDVDWSTKSGWYLNLPDTGERVHLEAQLYFGTLVVASTVPSATECQPGGYSWLYFLNYRTGSGVPGNSEVGEKFTSPVVGITVAKLPGGTPVVYPITADGGKPKTKELPIDTSQGGGESGRRVMWRELIDY